MNEQELRRVFLAELQRLRAHRVELLTLASLDRRSSVWVTRDGRNARFTVHGAAPVTFGLERADLITLIVQLFRIYLREV
jgi:hypothetical protein